MDYCGFEVWLDEGLGVLFGKDYVFLPGDLLEFEKKGSEWGDDRYFGAVLCEEFDLYFCLSD